MTAVAPSSTLQTGLARNGWPSSNGQISLNAMTQDEVSRMFVPRKSVQRTNSSSSVSSTSSTNTVTSHSGGDTGFSSQNDANGVRKKPARGFWPSSKAEPVSGLSTAKSQSVSAAIPGPSAASAISALHNPQHGASQHTMNSQSQTNGASRSAQNETIPMLGLSPLNGTFERKTIEVPYHPDVLKIGRQTNAKTQPTPLNGFFDSKVLSRQHAEVWAERDGKIWIRDVRSSNGTFVNGKRLSPENRDSEPHLLQEKDMLELGIDIVSEDGKTVVHHKVAARVEHAGIFGLGNNSLDIGIPQVSSEPGGGAPWSSTWRQRTNSNSSLASARSMQSYASGASGAAYGKWLQPVTMEQIVKKLNTELKQARLQSTDLKHTSEFVDAFINQEHPPAQRPPPKPMSASKINEVKARLATEPPAPPPTQPLPEKPDVAPNSRKLTDLPLLQPLLKRSDTERPSVGHQVPNGSPVKTDPQVQVNNLVEALQTAHKEMQSQTEKIKSMEEMLRMEREARSKAEQKMAAQPPQEDSASSSKVVETEACVEKPKPDGVPDVGERLEKMTDEMDRMRQQVEAYRRRAEAAEQESQRDRQTLSEMVASIKKRDEGARKRKEARMAKRQASQTGGSAKPAPDGTNDPDDDDLDEILNEDMHRKLNGRIDSLPSPTNAVETDLGKLAHARGTAAFANTIKDFSKSDLDELGIALRALRSSHAPGDVAVRSRTQEQLIQASPYASLVGVVLLGVGMMAYLNGWQRIADR